MIVNAPYAYTNLGVDILKKKGYYTGASSSYMTGAIIKAATNYIIDSEPGAIHAFVKLPRLYVAVVQCYVRELGFDPGKIDGYAGPSTNYAIDLWQQKIEFFRDIPEPKEIWPFEKNVPEFYGERGTHQVQVDCPYHLYLAWNNDVTTQKITIHEKCAESLTRILEAIHKEYGDIKIRTFGLDQFGGSLNVRLKRGSKYQWSMHSWGIAIDWHPLRNQLKWSRDKADLARPEYEAFWEIWEAEGWVSLGRQKNYDWMHVQAARV